MKRKQSLLLFLGVMMWFLASDLSAQRVMSLEECVNLAFVRSLELKNADLNMEQATVNIRQSKHARFPVVNGATSYGWNFGRAIDPTTNAFDNQSSNYQTMSVSAGMNIYQGGVINNSITQSEMSGFSAVKRKDALRDNIGLMVAQNYLNALLAEEAEKLANYQIELTRNQLQRLDRLIAAGSLPANDRLELEAQLYRDEQQVVLAQNNFELAILNLKNLLLIDLDEELILESVDPDMIAYDESILDLSTNDVFRKAINYQPSIKADSIDLKIAELDKKINEGRLMPTLGIGGSLNTNYSNLFQELVGTEDVVNDVPVVINGMEINVGFPTTQFVFDNSPYWNQIENNLGYGFVLSLNFPIYNNYSARLNVERSDINIRQVQVQNEINKQNLQATIQNAVAQARAARQAYVAAERSAVAQKNSLDNVQKKFDAGSANNFDFISAKNNLSMSENSLIQAKYDYIFKLKVIDYYLGKPLKL